MKLQGLAVMFIIIILPISMVLASYTESRVDTLKLQIEYDEKLDSATADAIGAFQINTYNGDESIFANYKMQDIQAAVNTFYNTMRTNFSMGGYNNRDIEDFVPALVFIMYDGYYIYSPYQNTWDDETIEGTDRFVQNGGMPSYDGGTTTDYNRELLYGLKPYVYYSCRYVNGSADVVITYALDNYVSIKGKIGNEVVDKSGYLLSDVQLNNNIITYRGNAITAENYRETVIVDGQIKNLPCRKVNGTKYYYDESTGETFHFFNNQKAVDTSLTFDIVQNTNAIEYYQQALDLKDYINSHAELKNLSTRNAVDENGNSLESQFGNYNIFSELFDGTIEDEDSLFNSHRLDIIKYSVERNLSIAVTNYNNYSSATTNFQMPQLKDYEWDQISNNISMISFLQGLPIGAKIYNGYSIVSNNKNLEYVSEDSIYILTRDNVYHNIKDSDLYDGTENLSGAVGYYNMNFERKSAYDTSGIKTYYYPVENVTGCYNSIVNRRDVSNEKISDMLNGTSELARVYYTALGRERYGLYRTSNNTNYTASIGDDVTKNDLKINTTVTYNDIQSEATITLNITGDDADSAIISYDNVPGIVQINNRTYRCTQNGKYTFYAKSADGSQNVMKVVTINGVYSNEDFVRYNVKPGDYIKYEIPNNTISISESESGYNKTQVINTQNFSSGYWQVLYNDSENGFGLQIVSSRDITSGNQFYLEGQAGYNNSVSILNNIASQFVNPTYADWGRALGLNPANPNDTAENAELLWGGNSGCKMVDSNYTQDLIQLKSYGMLKDNIDIWLASRSSNSQFDGETGYHGWNVRATSASGTEKDKRLFKQNYNNRDEIKTEGAGIRPVIKLKDNIRIIDGDGTISDPYVISI